MAVPEITIKKWEALMKIPAYNGLSDRHLRPDGPTCGCAGYKLFLAVHPKDCVESDFWNEMPVPLQRIGFEHDEVIDDYLNLEDQNKFKIYPGRKGFGIHKRWTAKMFLEAASRGMITISKNLQPILERLAS